jgi:hypothetical protein
MENNKEPESDPFLTKSDVMEIMGCEKSTAYTKLRTIIDCAENPKSYVGAKVRLSEFIDAYRDIPLSREQMIKIINKPKLIKQK